MIAKSKNKRPKQRRQQEENGLSQEEKIAKETQALIQLIAMPDFEVIDFFQTLLKSTNHQQVLARIPEDLKIRFFSDHYIDFLQTQDELVNIKPPELDQIPKQRQLFMEKPKQFKKEQNFDEASVLEILDSFSTAVLEHNKEEMANIFQMIQQMKKHAKYKKYFDNHSINKIFLESYNSFLDACTDCDTLLLFGEIPLAMRCHLNEKCDQILELIRTNINVNDSVPSIGKEMLSLVKYVQKEIDAFKVKFKKELAATTSLFVHITDWISRLVTQFYQLVEPYIYEKQELSQILQALGIIIENAAEMETQGLSFQRQLKDLIAQDLPSHISRVVEIIVETINQVMRDDDSLYEFVYFKSICSFSHEIFQLKPIKKIDFGKKCATTKGIILVNSFVLILSSLCDEKWAFLHQNVINILLQKIALNILATSLLYWDYYHIYSFFERLSQGKVRSSILFQGEISEGLKEKMDRIKRMSEESWKLFQNKVIDTFWRQVLVYVPESLWCFKKYAQLGEPGELRPTSFSLESIFKTEDFMKQFLFRLPPSQVEYLLTKLYEFFIYTMEYMLYWSYHAKGANEKVFLLYKKNDKLLGKAKEFAIQELNDVKEKKKILKLSYFTPAGLTRFAFEVHFLTDAIRTLAPNPKIDCDMFLSRVAQILAKEKNGQPRSMERSQFAKPIDKLLQIYKNKPQMMRNYVNEKRKSFNAT